MSKKSTLTFLFLISCAVPLRAQGPPAALVETVPAEVKEVRQTVTFTGTLEPRKRSVLASEIKGLVEELTVEEGDYVKKGQLLVRMKNSTTRLALADAETNFAEAEARHLKAQSDLERAKTLHEKGFISDEELQAKETDAVVAEKQMQTWQIKIIGYQGDLEKYLVKAPFAGLVADFKVEVGEWTVEGGEVAELLQMNPVMLTADVAERFVGRIEVGSEARVEIDALPEQDLTATVFAIVPQAKNSSRTFPVKLALSNPDLTLQSGMFARAVLAVGEPAEAILVPKDALVRQSGAVMVYAVRDGAAVPVPVEVGAAFGDRVAVQAQLEAGTPVVIKGNERIFPNQPVKIVNATPDDASE